MIKIQLVFISILLVTLISRDVKHEVASLIVKSEVTRRLNAQGKLLSILVHKDSYLKNEWAKHLNRSVIKDIDGSVR